MAAALETVVAEAIVQVMVVLVEAEVESTSSKPSILVTLISNPYGYTANLNSTLVPVFIVCLAFKSSW